MRRRAPERAPAAYDAGSTSAVAPTSRATWWRACLAGAISSFAIFLFIGWLQPTFSGNERIELPETIRIDLAGARAEKPRPPPPREQTPEETPRKERRPERKEQSTTQRSSAPRVRRVAAASASHMRPEIEAGLLGVTGLLPAGIGSGGGVGLQIPLQEQAMMSSVLEVRERTRERERIRDMSRENRLGGEGLQAAAGRFTPPKLVSRKDPVYPPSAQQRGIEGFVRVKVLISMIGTIDEIEIVAAQPKGVFEEAVLAALPEWQFEPCRDEKGNPVDFYKEFNYAFKLEDLR